MAVGWLLSSQGLQTTLLLPVPASRAACRSKIQLHRRHTTASSDSDAQQMALHRAVRANRPTSRPKGVRCPHCIACKSHPCTGVAALPWSVKPFQKPVARRPVACRRRPGLLTHRHSLGTAGPVHVPVPVPGQTRRCVAWMQASGCVVVLCWQRVMPPRPSLIHPLTHSLAHSPTRPLAHSLTHSSPSLQLVERDMQLWWHRTVGGGGGGGRPDGARWPRLCSRGPGPGWLSGGWLGAVPAHCSPCASGPLAGPPAIGSDRGVLSCLLAGMSEWVDRGSPIAQMLFYHHHPQFGSILCLLFLPAC